MDLFQHVAYTRARPTDPETSHEAAREIVKIMRPLQIRVMQELTKVWPEGLTHWELEERCNDHGSTFRTRVSELVDKKLVVDSGERRTLTQMGLAFDEGGKPRKGRNKRRVVWRLVHQPTASTPF